MGIDSVSKSSSFNTTNNDVDGSTTTTTTIKQKKQQQPTLRHQSSSFLRTYGLNLEDSNDGDYNDDEGDSTSDNDNDNEQEEGFPYSESPNPSDDNNACDWVALDLKHNGSNASGSTTNSSSCHHQQISSHVSASPCLSIIVESLVQNALNVMKDKSIWSKSTDSSLTKGGNEPIDIWTGYLPYDGYGSSIPAVKSYGIINNMSANELVQLLIDSSRVKEYNKNSIGRHDVIVYRNDLFSFDNNSNEAKNNHSNCTTKIIHSSAELPTSMIRVMFEFLSIFHVRKLTKDDNLGEGYICVSRAVESTHPTYKEPGGYAKATKPEKKKNSSSSSGGGFFSSFTGGGSSSSSSSQVVRGEILLNVHLIISSKFKTNCCQMTNINHIMSSSMIPSFIAKQIGLTAAINFINDIRAL